MGIALGVGVVLSIDLSIASAERSFELGVDVLAERATHRIQGGPEGLPAELHAAIAKKLHGLSPTPLIERDAEWLAPGQGRLKLVGIDPWTESELRPSLELEADQDALDAGRLATTVGGVWMSTDRALEVGIAVGSPLSVRVGARVQTFTLLGTFAPSDAAVRRATRQLLIMDLASAETAIQRFGRLDRIDLVLEGARPEDLQELHALLPAGTRLVATEERRVALSRMMVAFRGNLEFLALLALLVGALLVHNAMAFSVARRSSLFARLRGFGVLQGELLRLIVLEGFVFGAVGSALGLALGYGLAQGLVGVVATTVGDLYHAVEVQTVVVEPLALVKAFAAGLLTSVFAVLASALRAAQSSPLELARRSIGRGPSAPRTRRAVLAICALSIALFPLLPDDALWPCTLLLAGLSGLAAALIPSAVAVAVKAATPVARSLPARLAVRGARASIVRTRTAISALAFALAMGLGITLMIGSFRGAVTAWLDSALIGEVFVGLPRGVARVAGAEPLPEDVVRAVAASAGPERIVTNRVVQLATDRGELQLCAFGFPSRDLFPFRFLAGEPLAAFAAYRAGTGLIATEPLARRLDLEVGATIELQTTERGPVRLPIAAIVQDFATEAGYIVLAPAHYAALYGDQGVTTLSAFAPAGQTPEDFALTLERRFAETYRLEIRTADELRATTMAVFERTFRVTGALRLLAILVAIIGFVGALLALQIDRSAEFARLEARGQGRWERLKTRLLQTGFEGLIAGLTAAPLGLAFSFILTQEVQVRSFGWSLPWTPAMAPVLEAVLVGVFAAISAGLVASAVASPRPLTARLREE